jgi:hypothetical protein
LLCCTFRLACVDACLQVLALQAIKRESSLLRKPFGSLQAIAAVH